MVDDCGVTKILQTREDARGIAVFARNSEAREDVKKEEV